MPHERADDAGNQGRANADLGEAASPGSVDDRHLLLVGAGLVLEWPWHAASPWAATG
jgi:hypothetical protein